MGIVYCLFWPKMYSATALVVVQPQKVPQGIVKSTVTTKVEERLQIITQKILSRTRLTELIDRFGLYPKSRGKVAPNQLADTMRDRIDIKISARNYFTITFSYIEPKATAAVANALAAFFVNANLQLREKDSLGTARFLARELEIMRTKLSDWEDKITRFKEAHLHELPESVERNIALLGQEQNRDLQLDQHIKMERTLLSQNEARIFEISSRIEELKIKRAYMRKIGASVAAEGGGDERSAQAIRQDLEGLRIKYTENHPDIQRTKRLLEIAEAKEAAEKAKAKAKGGAPGKPDETKAQIGDLEAQRQRFAQKVAESKDRIKGTLEKKRQIAQNVEILRGRIENAPKIQEQLDQLTRGYSVLKKSYEKMHAQWLEANTSAALERSQRGEQFEVVDPAQVPNTPFRPSAKKALPAAFAMGLALALGLAFGMEYLDNSYTSVEQMERESELPVLVVVPPILSRAALQQKKRITYIVGSLYASTFMVLMMLIGLILLGREGFLRRLLPFGN